MPRLVPELEERLLRPGGRIRDDHVEAAGRAVGLEHRALALGYLGELGRDRADAGTKGADLRGDRVEAIGGVIDEVDGLGAFLGEPKCRGPADATASSSDEDDL